MENSESIRPEPRITPAAAVALTTLAVLLVLAFTSPAVRPVMIEAASSIYQALLAAFAAIGTAFAGSLSWALSLF